MYRPAAIEQLKLLGQRVNAPVFELGTSAKPAEIARQGVEKANKENFDTVIIDTAGRLQASFARLCAIDLTDIPVLQMVLAAL